MGIRGLSSFINQSKIANAITDCTIESFQAQIREYERY
jgi:hypothetical protein